MISSYVGENAEFEQQYLTGELEVELTPQVYSCMLHLNYCAYENTSGKRKCPAAAVLKILSKVIP